MATAASAASSSPEATAPLTTSCSTVSVTSTSTSTSTTVPVTSSSQHPQVNSLTTAPVMSAISVNDALNCDLCEFTAISTVGLKIHKSKKHEDIPQLDGESANATNPDCWWEKHNKYSLRSYQMYMDVLSDINETPLSENEKCLERDKVTNARKEAFGENYRAFPPWS